MESFKFWKDEGISLGLSGEELTDFIRTRTADAEAREARAYAREEKSIEHERWKLEKEREEKEKEREEKEKEREEKEKERVHREKEREHELEVLRLKNANPGIGSTGALTVTVDSTRPNPIRDNDEITDYLTRFERIASSLKWEKTTWPAQLASLLQGKALTIYTSLDESTVNDYDALKAALLKGYRRTSDHYRQEFRSTKIDGKMTYEQFMNSLFKNFDLWINSLECDKTYTKLREVIVCDQFLATLPKDIRLYVKERNPDSHAEISALADRYAIAHRCYPKEDRKPQKFKSSESHDASKDSKESKVKSSNSGKVTCYVCGDGGHISRNCPNKVKSKKEVIQISHVLEKDSLNDKMVCGTINGNYIPTILRDTGCNGVVISEDLVPAPDPNACPYVTLVDYLGREDIFPKVKAYIKCPLYEGWVNAARAPIKYCSVLLGDIPGIRAPTPSSEGNHSTSQVEVNAVTRQQAKRSNITHPLVSGVPFDITCSHDDFVKEQQSCPSLEEVRQSCKEGTEKTFKNGLKCKFVMNNGIIYRKILQCNRQELVNKEQLVVPQKFIKMILKISHDIPVGGHFSHRKTYDKVKSSFWWFGMTSDVYKYCKSCDICQKAAVSGRLRKAPMVKVPVIPIPFYRVAIDIVGPVIPASSEGHRYILTLVDYASSFTEAVPLKAITSVDIAEALLSIFSRVGIPKEIISDRGPQFKSDLMSQIHKLFGVKPIFSTPYHPQANGRVERQHQILKSILKKLCSSKQRQWHRYLPAVMFSMREIPSDSTGFSPFEILYGRQVRGPLSVLKELWTNDGLSSEETDLYSYVLQLRNDLSEICDIVVENMNISSDKYKTYFDLKSCKRKLKVNDEVLLLVPDKQSKLQLSWIGPYKVLERQGPVDYWIDVNGKRKLYHINLLKRYFRRSNVNLLHVADQGYDQLYPEYVNKVSVVEEEDFEELSVEVIDCNKTECNIGHGLTVSQKQDLSSLCKKYECVFSDIPGKTTALEHKIRVNTNKPFSRKYYPVPAHLTKAFDDEVNNLLSLGIIEPSSSNYSSPALLVKKKEGSYRLCVDYRSLNAITEFDKEPMPNFEYDLHKFSNYEYISELDICKAYHQVPLNEESKKFTAFPTNLGLMQYKMLPFGLSTACATYIRLMRIILKDLDNIVCYFDNIFVISSSWEKHLLDLETVLKRLQEYGLTAKPEKCSLGLHEVDYLGYRITKDGLKPQEGKVITMRNLRPPGWKKELRSFLGSLNFYGRLIPNLADNSCNLTNYLKKGSPDSFTLNDMAMKEFNFLKECLVSPPILKVPDLEKPFCLRTDASSIGLGGVLLQYTNDVPYPVAFASRKLLPRETRYFTSELECLAIVWAIKKFEYYLKGKQFILECDHEPLTYLESFKGSNARLMRWALALQSSAYRIVYVKGKHNSLADLLSRCTGESSESH